MYLNQKCSVQYGNCKSNEFKVTNGVKQGGVLSPLLFAMYLDVLLIDLSKSGYGCHIGKTFVGAVAYADDLALLSPSKHGLEEMIKICEKYSAEYYINFNASKSKMLVNSTNCVDTVSIKMQNNEIPIVKKAQHLGNYIGNNREVDQVDAAIRQLYSQFNTFIWKFSKCNVNVKYKLFTSYCMSLYGSQLWNFEKNKLIDKIYVAQRKCLRRLLDISRKTHSSFLNHIVGDLPLDVKLHRRIATFVHSCLVGNSLTRICVKLASNRSNSELCNTLNVLRYTYGFNLSVLNFKGIIYQKSQEPRFDRHCKLIKAFLDYRDCNTNEYNNITYILSYLCEMHI